MRGQHHIEARVSIQVGQFAQHARCSRGSAPCLAKDRYLYKSLNPVGALSLRSPLSTPDPDASIGLGGGALPLSYQSRKETVDKRIGGSYQSKFPFQGLRSS